MFQVNHCCFWPVNYTKENTALFSHEEYEALKTNNKKQTNKQKKKPQLNKHITLFAETESEDTCNRVQFNQRKRVNE